MKSSWVIINSMFRRYIFLTILMFVSSAHSATQDIRLFQPGSYAQLLKQQESQSFMLVFWSLDCPPCYKELAMLAKEIKTQPQLTLVLVSTDTPDDISEIQQKLAQFGFNNVNAWVFDRNSAQQLRYEIDPKWYGELPRSYLFDSRHQRQAITGILKKSLLQSWADMQARNDNF